uniref:Transmembrane protein 25 n=1 Tax=Anas platyrhynchos TaxID=8839 RepID=A0A8B9TQ70_ANAPL
LWLRRCWCLRRHTRLQFPAQLSARLGLREPGPTIDGRPLASCTLREEERRAFTCRAPRAAPGSVLTWYLDGRRQEANCSAAGTASSTLTITARRADRELNCSVTHPASGATANASVLLDVQYKPEILHADARYEEVDDAGLLLLLFVLVQANPPASITWVDQDGRVVANASEFLLLDTKHYPATNLSVSAANSLGVTTASLLPPGLLDAHVELPLLGVAVGSALALSALLGLGSLAACLACRRAKSAPGKSQAGGSPGAGRWWGPAAQPPAGSRSPGWRKKHNHNASKPPRLPRSSSGSCLSARGGPTKQPSTGETGPGSKVGKCPRVRAVGTEGALQSSVPSSLGCLAALRPSRTPLNTRS